MFHFFCCPFCFSRNLKGGRNDEKNTLLGMTLILLALNPAFAEAVDPAVVRVGDVTLTKSQVQLALNSDITLVEALEEPALTDEQKLNCNPCGIRPVL